MTNIIMHGCNGKMGGVVTSICDGDPEVTVVAGIDRQTTTDKAYPVYADVDSCDVEADVIIDFSNEAAIDGLLEAAVKKNLPIVLCTTGLTEEQIAKVEEAAKQIPILRSANMSLGINTLMDLLKKATEVFTSAGFDVEIVEKHHNQKLDAPSGTAIALADAVNDALPEKYAYVYDRSDKREKRNKKEIGIVAVRGGSIVGEHEVIFAGTDEVITLKHTAYSKAIFANGAVQAAKFLKGRSPGLYTMRDVIGQA